MLIILKVNFGFHQILRYRVVSQGSICPTTETISTLQFSILSVCARLQEIVYEATCRDTLTGYDWRGEMECLILDLFYLVHVLVVQFCYRSPEMRFYSLHDGHALAAIDKVDCDASLAKATSPSYAV